ncbi:MAG: sodium/proton-translocating pyrophosphatase, partial [Hyphomonadaceae bacterium]
MSNNLVLWLVIGSGVVAALYSFLTSQAIKKLSPGNARMQEIAAAIQEGARAYLKRQYTTIAAAGVVLALVLGFALGWLEAAGFVIGAVLSGAAGFIGMNVSVTANVRTAEAARVSLAAGLSTAFKSGAVTGMLVAGFALIGVAGYYYFLTAGLNLSPTDRTVVDALVSLGFGASLISIFARLGGGSINKGAEV